MRKLCVVQSSGGGGERGRGGERGPFGKSELLLSKLASTHRGAEK